MKKVSLMIQPCDADCRIIRVDEHGEKIEDEFWVNTNLGKLLAYLLIVGEKYIPDNIV
jgi:hypothetical protein